MEPLPHIYAKLIRNYEYVNSGQLRFANAAVSTQGESTLTLWTSVKTSTECSSGPHSREPSGRVVTPTATHRRVAQRREHWYPWNADTEAFMSAPWYRIPPTSKEDPS